MIPVWYVEMSYLQQEYGRKGEPRPAKLRENVDANVTLPKVPNEAEADPAEGRADAGKSHSAPLLLSDAAFLQERIRTLEQQNQQEKVRHDRIIEKLFAQLDVKDKQISAWDEVTQGLTKGLATGQLAPRLLSSADDRSSGFRAGGDESKQERVQEAELVEQSDKQSRRSEAVSSKGKGSGLRSEMDSSMTAAENIQEPVSAAAGPSKTKTRSSARSKRSSNARRQKKADARSQTTKQTKKRGRKRQKRTSIWHRPVSELFSLRRK